ncbi:MAG: hypothetical protein LBQ12_05945 [Deltaproteobacteria bacterium]|nr:hypothetical protein [Deltaproteobacteria bacterium]
MRETDGILEALARGRREAGGGGVPDMLAEQAAAPGGSGAWACVGSLSAIGDAMQDAGAMDGAVASFTLAEAPLASAKGPVDTSALSAGIIPAALP